MDDRDGSPTYGSQPGLVVPIVDGRGKSRSCHNCPLGSWGGSGVKAAELVAGLESTWGMIDQALASWTPADLGHAFLPPASLNEAERSIFGERTLQQFMNHRLQNVMADVTIFSSVNGAVA
jgi:hypothetical protein